MSSVSRLSIIELSANETEIEFYIFECFEWKQRKIITLWLFGWVYEQLFYHLIEYGFSIQLVSQMFKNSDSILFSEFENEITIKQKIKFIFESIY